MAVHSLLEFRTIGHCPVLDEREVIREDRHDIVDRQATSSRCHTLVSVLDCRKPCLERLPVVPTSEGFVKTIRVLGQVQRWRGFHRDNDYSDDSLLSRGPWLHSPSAPGSPGQPWSVHLRRREGV